MKQRKKCHAQVNVIPGYKDYSLVSFTCHDAIWKTGFSLHNFFGWGKDYYSHPTLSLYLDEDMLEKVRVELKLDHDKVIRLRKYYSVMETIPFIKEYEVTQAYDTG